MKIFKCRHCNNIIELFDGDNKDIKCCNDLMNEEVPNSSEGDVLKHKPACVVDGGIIRVSVGEISHPMEEDHFITFIAMIKDGKRCLIDLKPGDEPVVTFPYREGSVIYVYCNKHGLWSEMV